MSLPHRTGTQMLLEQSHVARHIRHFVLESCVPRSRKFAHLHDYWVENYLSQKLLLIDAAVLSCIAPFVSTLEITSYVDRKHYDLSR